ncbi:signal recognition particle protein Srp19 [Fervidicoccus fontis]|uniref:Signal recognition particle 19 kDa protein n=2 Tax=Fervidicoccus fontis TaxID=683846 RepID=I0A2K7_FERFK|nr:signal recognition particle subunit SRP19/SEC65 family protein [Fervidicoccus fontis]AFH43214.1 signal recognition particle protein Srp19 [Fervidicoccus fontis Kam940]MBE9390594.1 signal recognition particle protein Srp19 [Fervidicoccus fontis]
MSSRGFKGKKIVIYPSYLDCTSSRTHGRKIPKSLCVQKPSISEILEVAKGLSLNPILEDKKFPKKWWEIKQRVIVDKRWGKIETLKRICIAINDMRKKGKKE